MPVKPSSADIFTPNICDYNIFNVLNHECCSNVNCETDAEKDFNKLQNISEQKKDVLDTRIELKQVLPFYIKNKDNLKFANININSLRYKFAPLAEILGQSMLDILSVQETKLDSSFPDSQFMVPGYRLHRKDHQRNSGGLLMLIRDDIPHVRRYDLENITILSGRIELMVLEIVLKNEKWLLFNMYKQPQVSNRCLVRVIEDVFAQMRQNVILFGDLNINMLKAKNCIQDVLDVAGLKNLVNVPTCDKGSNPSLLDLVITNVPKRIQNVTCIESELSDCHKMICWATKIKVPISKINKTIRYRSYKHFDEAKYKNDLYIAPFHVSEIFDNVDDSLWFCSKLLTNIIDENAPVKTRKIRNKQVPYMNGELRKAINVRNMLRRKFLKTRSSQDWNKYKKLRNFVTHLRRKSILQHISLKCNKNIGSNGREFWKTIKPIMSFKGRNMSNNIILLENDKIISQPQKVSNILNEYYITATQGIGQSDYISYGDSLNDIIEPHINADCITYISSLMSNRKHFSFSTVTTDEIHDRLKTLNTRKATGHDTIPPKLIKLGAKPLSTPITMLINQCIGTSDFPNLLKLGEVTPVFKKDDVLNKKNYRPVSTLPCISKIFEGVFVDQLNNYFTDIFSPFLSGFRKNHSCQSVLLHLVENCKMTLDRQQMYGSLLTDLSKAFDCLPHRLLIAKLNAYGVSNEACTLVAKYFQERYQRVKIGNTKSEWMEITKGCPQGSLMCPLAYNIFSNDLLLTIQNICDVYNYADDNSVGCSGNNPEEITNNLKHVVNIMLKWFKDNYLKANPDKFQFILFSKLRYDCTLSINEQVNINSSTEV